MKMIIGLLLLRLICFLYIVLFVVSLVFFILYGHYKRCVITDDVSNDCKINIRVQRIQCTQCKFTHSLLPSNFIPYTIIPIGVKAAEVTVISKSVFEHAKASNVAKAYEKLTQETVHSEKVKRTGTQER